MDNVTAAAGWLVGWLVVRRPAGGGDGRRWSQLTGGCYGREPAAACARRVCSRPPPVPPPSSRPAVLYSVSLVCSVCLSVLLYVTTALCLLRPSPHSVLRVATGATFISPRTPLPPGRLRFRRTSRKVSTRKSRKCRRRCEIDVSPGINSVKNQYHIRTEFPTISIGEKFKIVVYLNVRNRCRAVRRSTRGWREAGRSGVGTV